MEKRDLIYAGNPDDVQTFYYDHKIMEDGRKMLQVYGCEHDGVLCFAVPFLSKELLDLGEHPDFSKKNRHSLVTLYGKQVYDTDINRIMPCDDEMFYYWEGRTDLYIHYRNLDRSLATCIYSIPSSDQMKKEEAQGCSVFTAFGVDDWKIVPVENERDLDFILGSRKQTFEEEFVASMDNGELRVMQKEGALERFQAKWEKYEAGRKTWSRVQVALGLNERITAELVNSAQRELQRGQRDDKVKDGTIHEQ